jgi:GNAT superfamily N-acetyltransferase
MAAKTIYGPHGGAIAMVSVPDFQTVQGGTPLTTQQALAKIDEDAMLAAVEKRVKAQGTTLSQVWDPSRGKPKPTSVTYQTLRTMARRNEWIRAIIKTRKNQVGKAPWSILPVDEETAGPAVEALCTKITNLLKRPSMHGSRASSRSWRAFINEVLEDVLVLDQGIIEKEWDLSKWIAGMYPVDGATMAPNMDERGGFHDDAYVQVVDGQVTARFGIEDLVWIMDNPQTDVQFAGFGFSPLEGLIVSVSAELYASKYNASYFEKGAVPEGMINLGPEAAPEDVNAFRLYWMNEVMGRPWAIPIVGGSKTEWIPWRATNKDMEYMAYQEWLLKKMTAAYQMSTKEMNLIQDVNRSTADSEDTSETEKGVQPLLSLLSDSIEVEIIGEHGLGVQDYVKFAFDEEEESPDIIDQRFAVRVSAGMATRGEWREAAGMEPGENEGLDEFFTDTEVLPLPSTPEDIEALSGAAKAEQKSEEAKERFAELNAEGKGGGGNATSEPAPEFGSAEAEKIAKAAGSFTPMPGHTLEQHLARHAPGVEHSVSERPGRIDLNKVVVPKAQRGSGLGHHFMGALTGYADHHAAQVRLNPDTSFGGTSRRRLIGFYKQHGFVENKGRHRDLEISHDMYREPQPRIGKVADMPNPQLLEQQANAEGLFEDASSHLVAELSEILGMPLHKTVGLPERRQVALAELRVDTDYHRPEDREKIESMHRRLKAGIPLDGDITVNEREDGSLWITDGQHRVKAMMLNGQTHAEALVSRLPQQSEQKAANLVTAHA